MRIMRFVIAVLIALYALQNALFAIFGTSVKFGWTKVTEASRRLEPLIQDTSVLQLALGWVSIILFFYAALRLVRDKPALGVYLGAFVTGFTSWLIFKLGAVYDTVFTPSEQRWDYVLFGMIVIVGVIVWLMERRVTKPPEGV